MKKKLLLLVLSFCLVLGLVGAMMPAVLAGETPTEGNLGDSITWRFDPETGVLTLSGTGGISIPEEGAPWAAWIPQISAVEVTKGITAVGYAAFSAMDALESVKLPEGLTTIGKYAFSGSALKQINIPDSVEEIGKSAFYYCRRLERISIPAKTHSIGKNAFLLCDSLRSIDVAAGNSWYSSRGSGALMNKEGTQLLRVPGGIGVEFAVPDGVEYIAPRALMYCTELVAVDLPDTLKTIGYAAFAECENLRHLTIPAGVTKLGHDLLGIFHEGVTEEECKLVVEFTGDMPVIEGAFHYAILTAYYPEGNLTWAGVETNPSIGSREGTWIPYVPHTYGDWEILEEPTATEYGLKKRVCTDCGKEDTRPINKLDAEEIITNPFTDIRESDYFYTPVLWAASEGITTGTTATTFTPHASCTRAQIVTFLWRAMGEPKPEGSKNPFVDVKKGEYYYDAVLWAVEQGITTGVTSTTFAPNATCTRGQVVTFLWRAAGCPEPEKSSHSFTDLKTAEYYYDAVLWAVEQEITNGMTSTTFQPNGFCTRGQVVTFLWRYLV